MFLVACSSSRVARRVLLAAIAVTIAANQGVRLATKLMALLRAIVGHRQNLGPILIHQDRVFKLGRQFAVFGSNGPAIMFVADSGRRTDVDHRLDGETHSWKEVLATGLAIGNVRDVRALPPRTESQHRRYWDKPKQTENCMNEWKNGGIQGCK